MATTTDTDPQPSGFSDEEKAELEEMITRIVGGALPPKAEPTGPAEPAKPTDAEWDNMTEKRRENWVREWVDFRLDELAKLDADRRRDDEIEALKSKQEVESSPADRPPGLLDKFRKFMWGEQDPS